MSTISSRNELHLALGAELNALLGASRALTEKSAAAFQPGVQPAAFHLARWLLAYGPATPSTLAEAVAMDRSSTSALIRQMRELGLVQSEPDPSDRRSVIVSLTELGETRVQRALDLRGSTFFDRTAGWSDEELGSFVRLLHAFNAVPARSPH